MVGLKRGDQVGGAIGICRNLMAEGISDNTIQIGLQNGCLWRPGWAIGTDLPALACCGQLPCKGCQAMAIIIKTRHGGRMWCWRILLRLGSVVLVAVSQRLQRAQKRALAATLIQSRKGSCRRAPEEIWWWCRAAKSFDILHRVCSGVHQAWLRMRCNEPPHHHPSISVVSCFEFSLELPTVVTRRPPGHPSTKVLLMKLLLVSVLYLHLAGCTATQEADECADSPSLLSVKDVKGWKVSNVEMESVNMSMEEACQKDGSWTDERACYKRNVQDTVACDKMWWRQPLVTSHAGRKPIVFLNFLSTRSVYVV